MVYHVILFQDHVIKTSICDELSTIEEMTPMRPLIIGSEVLFIFCVFCSSANLKHGEHGEGHTQLLYLIIFTITLGIIDHGSSRI